MKNMMQLGPIRFSIGTAAYQNLQRSTQYAWKVRERVVPEALKRLGLGGPGYQYNGPGDDTINLNGTIYPQFNGGAMQVSLMRLAAGTGVPLPLIEGSGFILGLWIITRIGETNSIFFANGESRKIEFTLELKRYYEDQLYYDQLEKEKDKSEVKNDKLL